MRIPLDYYRILGLPIQATAEQLQQAFRDRTLQLPRREYSEAAINARRQLLDEAYSVLADPERRQTYDESFLAKTYESEQAEKVVAAASGEIASALAAAAIDPNTPSIEIDDDQFVGALLILQELGEYELVLNLGRPHLSSSFSLKSVRLREHKLVLPDIVLTIALACLELGREYWQQGQYENAATSLEMGQEILLREGLFASVRGEIQADIYKLRPYRILELLAQDNQPEAERQRGLKLLQDVLQDRGGIDGKGDDRSGLSIDDFLRFIQQLRGYLRAGEQQALFEEEARRPSAVATYLAVYALLGKGFAEHQPALIRRAKLMLMRLSKRQDVHLEQAVCALLLGQTEEASRALDLSQEYEPLAFIREHSQGSPDLLPGLCLYGERWLQEEVFPHFRDLTDKHTSLKDYFADMQVQTYLEALPNETETANEWTVLDSQPLPYSQSVAQTQERVPLVANAARLSASGYRSEFREMGSGDSGFADRDRQRFAGQRATATLSAPLERASGSGTSASHRSERGGHRGSTVASNRLHQPSEGVQGNATSNGSHPANSNSLPSHAARPGVRLVAAPRSLKAIRVFVVFAIAALTLGLLGFVASKTFGVLRQAFAPQPEQPLVELDQPLISVPQAEPEETAPAGPLTEGSAQQAIESWLALKARALGPNHEIEILKDILVNPALTKRQQQATEAKQERWHWQYEHDVKVLSVKTSEDNPDRARVEAAVKESAKFYEAGQLKEDSSYDDNLKVKYDLVRQDDRWRIRDMAVLR